MQDLRKQISNRREVRSKRGKRTRVVEEIDKKYTENRVKENMKYEAAKKQIN